MKESTKKNLVSSAYFLSLAMLGFSGYELYHKEYFNSGIIFAFSMPITLATYLGPKLSEIENEADRILKNKSLELLTGEEYDKAA